VPILLPTEQKEMQALVDRRHPRYDERVLHWDFCRATYDGGREWFGANIFKYLKEGAIEFEDRQARAYRFNHTKEIVRLVTKYIFKSGVIRNTEEAPRELKRFWKKATLKGAPINSVMGRICDLSSIYGRIWVVVDSRVPGPLVSRADEKAGRARLFVYTVTPDNMLDYAWDDQGELTWAMWRISHRDDADPVLSSGAVTNRFALWTRDEWVVLEERQGRTGAPGRPRREIVLVDRGENPIGRVPVFPVDEMESDDPYDVPALIGDIAYLDRAVANYLSNLDAIIQDQTFSQLALPAQGLLPGDEAHGKMLEMGTKRIFIYDGEAGRGPEYLSPDPKQAAMILAVVNKVIAEIYHSVGMAGERTKQDNAIGIDNSSGVAKAYDFERVNSLLTSKADALERAEDQIISLVASWSGIELVEDGDGEPKDLVKYPDSFDVRSLYDEFEIAQQLSLLEAPEEARREQMRGLVAKLFPRHPAAKLAEIEADIKKWPPQIEVETGLMTSERSSGAVGSARKTKPEAKSAPAPTKRQGQVTSETL
jgi:hypothetical protein